MRSLFSSLFVLVLSAATIAPVLLEPAPLQAQSREDIRKAKERFREGKDAYNDERYVEAAEAFVEAYELSGRGELLYNIGQAYRLAGDLKKAEQYLQQYLQEQPDAPNADAVVETVIEIQQQLAAQMATVNVEITEPKSQVFVDAEQEPRCETPCAVSLPHGEYDITIRAEGYKDHKEKITLEPAQRYVIKTQLEKRIVPGRIMFYTDRPGGRLRIGTDIDAELPLQEPISLEPGDYAFEIASVRNTRWQGRIKVEPDEDVNVMVPMQPLVEARRQSSPFKLIAYSLWGLSAAMTTGGIFMGLQTRATYNALSRQYDERNWVDADILSQGRSQQVLSNVMFGVGATSAAAGIALYLWDEFRDEAEP